MQHPPCSETSHLPGTSLGTPRRDRPGWVLAQVGGGGQEHPVLLGRPGLRGGSSPRPTGCAALALPRGVCSPSVVFAGKTVHAYVLAARYLTKQEEREQSRNVPLAHPPASCPPWREPFHLHAGAGLTAPRHSWLAHTDAHVCEGTVCKSVKTF